MNAITSNPEYKDAFLHWCLDHHKHFGCWPGSFIYAISETDDIDFPESVVWEAIYELFPNANNDYERRVRELEAEGMTRSDAQGVADAELMR